VKRAAGGEPPGPSPAFQHLQPEAAIGPDDQ